MRSRRRRRVRRGKQRGHDESDMQHAPSRLQPETRNPKPETRNQKPSLGQIDPDALDLRVLLERVVSALAAEARLLVAPERQTGIVEVVRVHPHGPGLEGLRRTKSLLDVLR